MTDTTVSLPIQIDAASISAKRLNWIASLFTAGGRSFGALLVAYGHAAELAYSAPFQTAPRRHKHDLAEDLAGRDPHW